MIYLTDLYRIFLPLGIPMELIELIFKFMPKWICNKDAKLDVNYEYYLSESKSTKYIFDDKIILSKDFLNIFSDNIVFWHDHRRDCRPYSINENILNDIVYYLMYLISRGHRFCNCIYPVQDHTQRSRFWFTDNDDEYKNYCSKYANFDDLKQREEYCSCVQWCNGVLYHMCPCHYLYYTCDANQKYVSPDLIQDDNDIEIISIHSHNLNNELESFIEYNDGNNFEEKFNELVEFIHTFSSSNLNEVYVKSVILLDNIPKIKQFFSVPNNKLMVLKQK